MSAETDNEQTAREHETGLPGPELKKARELRGLKVEDIAGRLNLGAHVIMALESNDYTDLPEPAYIRGYILSYAKLLDVPRSILKPFDQRFDLNSPLRSTNTASSDSCGEDGWIKCISSGLFVFLVIVVGLWFVENSFHLIDRIVPFQQEQSEKVSASVKKDNVEAQVIESNAVTETVAKNSEEPIAVSQGDAVDASEALLVDDSIATVSDSQQDISVQEPDFSLSRIDDLAARTGQLESIGDTAATMADVVLVFKGGSWAKVDDADGELSAGTFDSGHRIELNGSPPIEIVLGKPENVELMYKGKPVDLTSYHNKVARLTLSDQVE